MPLFGAHMSIAGGYHRALVRAQEYECEAVQLFASQPRTWPVKAVTKRKASLRIKNPLNGDSSPWQARELTSEEVSNFHEIRGQTGVRALMAHDSYLINLASPDQALYRRSLEAFIVEVERAERLGLAYLVTHPGAHVGSGEEAGLERVIAALDEVHVRCPGYRVRVLLETTAGQGSCLGYRFEHLARILDGVAEPDRLGVCLDTCHVFAAGYGLAPRAEYRATMRTLDRLIGLDRLLAFHLNDSARPRGSRVDRHAHIGRGHLGLEAFQLLVKDRRFRDRPMVLETPKEDGRGGDMDAINLRTLRALCL
jgi:deoxyribonuclease-4